ncbi:MAG: TolC family protein [bacterium]
MKRSLSILDRSRRSVGLGGLVVILGCLWLSGPAVAQNPAPPEFTPKAPLGEVVVARDGGETVIGLQTCVENALLNNDALRAERLRRQELDGQMYQALATGLPYIDVTGEWSRSRDPSFALDETFGGGGDSGFGIPTGADQWFLDWLGNLSFLPEPNAIPAQTYYRASLNLNWIVNPVKVLGAVGAANLGIDRQDLAIAAAEHLIAEQTISAYHGIIQAAEQVAAVEAAIANREEFLEIGKLRFELGLATDLDTLQAAVELANTLPQLRRACQALRNAGARLNALMGVRPEQPLAIQNEQVLETGMVVQARALELALRRPDLTQVALLADILRKNRSAQKADMRPYLSLDGAYGYVGKEIGDLDNDGFDFWRASIAVNIPLFDGLLTKGKVKETEASIRRTEVELSDQKRQVRVEIVELLTNLEVAHDNLSAAQLNLERSEDVLERLLLMYRLGKADYLSVLDSEANRSEAQSNLIGARYEVLTLTASLKRAVGFSPLLPMTAIAGLVQGESE